MLDRSANIDLTPYLTDRASRQISATLDDLEEALKVTNWRWHEITDEEEAAKEKVSYDKMRSVYDALVAKYYQDRSMLRTIKELHNKYAPQWYDIP